MQERLTECKYRAILLNGDCQYTEREMESMKRVTVLLLALMMLFSISACSNNESSNDVQQQGDTSDKGQQDTSTPGDSVEEPVSDAEQIRLDTYAELVDLMDKIGFAYTSNEDINNPNKVVSYYTENQRTLGAFTVDMTLAVNPLEVNEPIIRFTWVKYGSGGLNPNALIGAYGGHEYVRHDETIAIEFDVTEGTFDVAWMHNIRVRDYDYDDFELYEVQASGIMKDISASEYTADMTFPDIEQFKGYVEDRSTIREEILELTRMAVNDMCLLFEGYGISVAGLGFEHYTPTENPVIKTEDEQRELVAGMITEKFPEYISECKDNGGGQLYVHLSAEGGFGEGITTTEDEELAASWEEFLQYCLHAFYDNMPDFEYSNLSIGSRTWDIIFYDANGDSISGGYFSYDFWNDCITVWDEETRAPVVVVLN